MLIQQGSPEGIFEMNLHICIAFWIYIFIFTNHSTAYVF